MGWQLAVVEKTVGVVAMTEDIGCLLLGFPVLERHIHLNLLAQMTKDRSRRNSIVEWEVHIGHKKDFVDNCNYHLDLKFIDTKS